uniref:RIKEN cDNA 3830403N18 gene like n=1 Tax=Rattus norvegicus TaxID=10116 RepID=A0A8I6AFA4_RAT
RNLREVMTVPMDESLILFDFDDEEDDTNVLEKALSEENVSFSVKRQNFQGSLETPMEICYLSSDEEKDGSTSEKEVFEERTPLTQDDGNANPEEIVGDTQKKINSKFCKQYITTFQKFDMDVQKFNEEQEKSAGLMDLETNNHDMLFGIDGELRKE